MDPWAIVFFWPVYLLAIIFVSSSVRAVRRCRTRSRMAVRPTLIPTEADQIPASAQAFIGQLTKSLNVLGFSAVANLQSPDMSRIYRWVQVVFAKRDTCDRVSIICQIFRSRVLIICIFVTDSGDGDSVQTSVGTESCDVIVSDPADCESIKAAYTKHRERVELRLAGKQLVSTPPAGEELPWLGAKLADVTRQRAKQAKFVMSRDKRWYVPTVARSFRASWRTIWPMRMFFLFKKKPPAGFDVIVNQPDSAATKS